MTSKKKGGGKNRSNYPISLNSIKVAVGNVSGTGAPLPFESVEVSIDASAKRRADALLPRVDVFSVSCISLAT